MPDLRQALRDFVTTSNSGKYSDEATLLSKFPELKGYSIDALRDFVTTSNSGKYATEDELLAKFPEFGIGATEIKKKEVVLPPSPSPNATDLPLGIGSLEYAKPTKPVAPVQEGPTEKVSVGPMGMVGLERTKEYVPAKDQGKQGTILNTVSSLDKGFYKNLIGSPVKGLGTALEGVTGKGFVSDALIKFGDYFNKTIDELTPQDEEFKNTLTDQFGQAFGQVASLIVTSGVAGLASKAPTAAGAAQAALAARTAPTAGGVASALKTLGSELASPVSISAGLSMGQSEFERAKQAGATDEQAFEAFYKNAAVGSVLERIPVMQFLKRFDKASAGGITNYIKTKGVAGLTGGFEEMTTEILQGIYANLTAQDIYDANQDIFEGIGEAGGVGFGVGFLLNAMGANARILRNQGREEEAQVVENQIAQFESQAANGGVSSYKMGGVKIESPEIISNMIDNMSAADLTRANIEIENDPELNNKLQNKIITSSVKEQVRQGNPDLNEDTLDAITDLELELRKLEGNTTQTGKDRAAAIRTQIKNIQENQLTEEVDNSARIAELEAVLSSADRNLAETGFTSLSQDARVEIEKELQDLKTKQDVQKQTAGQVSVQSGTEDSGKVAEGEPQAEPQVTTEEGDQEKEVAPEMTERDEDNERVRLGDKVFEAKKNIARASDTEAAIEEYNAAKKKLEDFEASIQQRKDKKRSQSNIESLIDDENTAYQREGYEYKDLYDQDPRLAALQNAKDMVEWLESGESEKSAIAAGENPEEAKKSIKRSLKYNQQNIADLEADLEANPLVSSKTQEEAIPKYVKDVSVLITPATVRGFDKTTNKIKALSIKYDTLVKQFSKSKDKKVLDKIKEIESQILNSAKQEVIDKVSKVNGVAVQFKDNKMGLWDKRFEPSFNMTISVSPQANTKDVSDLLFDFSEKYSQDAFILESDSDMVIDSNSQMPLSEIGKDGLMHYPQLIYTFDTPITDEQLADISVALENNGLDAFNINNNEVKVSVIKTFTEDEQQNLDENEQRESRQQDYNSKTVATAKSIYDVLGSNAKGSLNIRVRKSSYQGAVNEGTQEQTRKYNRSDVFKEFKESSTKVEKLGSELSKLRQKQIELQKEGKRLSKEEDARLQELSKIVQPVVQRTFEANKKLYEEAKTEVEGIAKDAIKDVNATVSPFPIKRAERASVKAIRWYGSFTEKLGDGARVNIVVDTDADADKVFDTIDKKYPGDKELRRISTTTELGYPKRLIEIRTSNGTIAEIQVITNEAYLAKDGVQGFTGDENQKNTAKRKLQEIRNRLGWNIPDGLGHYFYEIQRDSNIEESLRDEAARLSDLYYDAFSNPKSTLSESFIKDALEFKKRVDAADKSTWDAGNKGIAPKSLTDYKFKEVAVVEEEQYEPITEKQISYEKFTRDNAIDYEEDTRETDSGREVTYLSRVTVEALDDNSGDVIGGLVKIVDEDKNVTWQALDVDGNELGKEDFDSLEEAKTALVNKWNKTQKKEFDKEAKRKAKAAEKEAAKKAKAEEKAATKKPKTAPVKQKAPPIQEGPTDEDLSEIDALLDLDVENEDNMQIVLNALDKANKALNQRLFGQANNALLAIPLNVVSVVIKALKAAVKGGMMLRDAIRKVSAENNLSQQIVKDILNVSEIQEGFDALMVKVDEMIARQTRRGTPEARMISNIDTLVRNSEVYQNANDAQKKILEREARARAGVSARRAPSIGRILGVLKDITNVSRQDKLAIISKIRQLSKDAAKDLAAEIKELAKGGKITANQATNIVARFGKVNMLSEISVSKFVDYMTKVFNDAEYASKLSKAKSTKKELSSLSRNKDKNANLRDLAQQFIKIDPAMVEDIDAYNEMASKIKESIKGSTIRGQKVSFAETVNIDNATEYINKTLDAQLEAMKAEKAAEIQSLMGIDVSDFSYDDMMMLLEGDKPITKYNEGIIRSTINKAFSVFSSIIKESISTGKDPFTGEDVKFTESQKDVVKRFMAMDLNILKPKEALQAVDALANFLQNQSTAKMEAVVSKYTGIANAAEVNEKGIVASPLKKYWSKTIGRILGEQTTNLNVLFERMFKGFNKGGFVMDKMGLTKLINKKSFAQKQANNIVDAYVEKFYKLKANGEAFNSAYNNIERGMAAFMMRNVIGTEQEMKAEFNRRKNLMEESISALEKGNEKERERAKLYQQAYDNILKDSKNIDDIKKKTDKVNLDGIDFWMNEWSNKFEQLSDVSENVYNKVLDKDINYTPDRFYKLSSDTGTVEIGEDDSAFIANSGLSNLYQRATGVLMTAVRPETLPVNPESGDVNRYIDLSFDNNNSNSMYDALVDINTAAPIRQIQAFLNSSDFKKIVPTSEDAKILKDRIQLYVRNIRDKNPYSNDELSSVVRKLNKIAAIGVGQALGGITQPIKQVIPVAINTLINGGGLDLSASFNQAKNAFINNSGYAIASRGLESQAQIESLNKLIDEVSETKGEKLMAGIEKLNKWWLDKFLVKPDVFIARASWLTYYEKYLKDNGLYGTTVETKTPSGKIEVTTEGIDYNTHQLNEDAANYAQRMVDRQQNVSDTDLAGKLFASRESANQLLVKTLMPFASFRMNQSARLGADLATITNKTSTKEDKKVAWRSVGGFASEMVTFRLVSIGISVLLGSLAKEIMGVDEDDEEKQKRIDNIVKGAKTGTFTDIFSPVPIADKLVQAGGALITQSIEDATGLPTAIYSPRKEEFLQNAGLFGIAADRAAQLWEISNLATTGEYTDDFGKEKTISSDAQEGLSFLIPAAILTNIGLAPSEVNTIVRYAIKDSKKSRKSSQEKAEKAERKQDTEETKKQKLDAFENVKQETSDPAVLDAIDEKIKELRATSEQKKEIEKKNKAERVLKQSLLVDPETGEEYDTETEMKRYNKDLWEKNFGENSEWYQSHEAEKEATKLLNKEIRKMEDEEYDYTAPAKKKRARNSDGTFKRKGGFGSAKFGGG